MPDSLSMLAFTWGTAYRRV